MSYGFQQTLDQIRAESGSHAGRGALFERLMRRYFREDPLYTDRFTDVWLWSEWAARRTDFTGQDTGGGSGCRGARGRLLRHPMQVPRAGNPHLERRSRLVYLRIGAGSVHAAHGRRYWPHVGAERRQDHRGPDAGLSGGAVQRPRRPPHRLAKPAAARPRSTPLASRGVQSASTSEGCRRGRGAGFRRPRPRQAHHGVRHREDVHGHVHRRDHGRRRRADPLPGAFDLVVPAVDAGVGRAADRAPSLHRDLFGHPRRAQRRGRFATRA